MGGTAPGAAGPVLFASGFLVSEVLPGPADGHACLLTMNKLGDWLTAGKEGPSGRLVVPGLCGWWMMKPTAKDGGK